MTSTRSRPPNNRAANKEPPCASGTRARSSRNPTQTTAKKPIMNQSESDPRVSVFDLGREKVPAEKYSVDENVPKASPFNMFANGAAKEKIVSKSAKELKENINSPDDEPLIAMTDASVNAKAQLSNAKDPLNNPTVPSTNAKAPMGPAGEKRRLKENEGVFGGVGFQGRSGVESPTSGESSPKVNLTVMNPAGAAKKGNSNQFSHAQEQPDLTYVNPLAVNAPVNPITSVDDVKKRNDPHQLHLKSRKLLTKL